MGSPRRRAEGQSKPSDGSEGLLEQEGRGRCVDAEEEGEGGGGRLVSHGGGGRRKSSAREESPAREDEETYAFFLAWTRL
jgi:hypothetical protein